MSWAPAQLKDLHASGQVNWFRVDGSLSSLPRVAGADGPRRLSGADAVEKGCWRRRRARRCRPHRLLRGVRSSSKESAMLLSESSSRWAWCTRGRGWPRCAAVDRQNLRPSGRRCRSQITSVPSTALLHPRSSGRSSVSRRDTSSSRKDEATGNLSSNPFRRSHSHKAGKAPHSHLSLWMSFQPLLRATRRR